MPEQFDNWLDMLPTYEPEPGFVSPMRVIYSEDRANANSWPLRAVEV